MPTGVPMPDARDQLFDAAARVLLRDGADALTSRAVTIEAGVAKGLLHRHFADFDTFCAVLVLTRIERLDDRSAQLRASAGSATVAENIAAALTAALDRDTLALVGLVMARRDLLVRLRLTTPTGIPLLAETTRMIAAYLTAERGLGRITLHADVDRLALALVGAAYVALAGGEPTPGADEIRTLTTTVMSDALQDDDARPALGPPRPLPDTEVTETRRS